MFVSLVVKPGFRHHQQFFGIDLHVLIHVLTIQNRTDSIHSSLSGKTPVAYDCSCVSSSNKTQKRLNCFYG